MIEKIHPGGVCLVTPNRLFRDHRGVFLETYRDEDVLDLFEAAGVDAPFLPEMFEQGNLSVSNPFVLRGMHYAVTGLQAKLIRCVAGSIYQVSVDVRKDSPTFGQWIGVCLDAVEHKSVFVPPGFANGFVAREFGATVHYEMTEVFNEKADRALAWDDPTVGIKWPMGVGAQVILSKKDREAPRLDAIESWTP